jgi:serine/threonine protein kinase
LLRRNKSFPEEVAKFYAAEILVALEYLHSRNIIYRDLKPENVLLGSDGHIKLTDFGMSKVCFSKNEMAYSMCGTPEYIAPEVILGKGYNETADWFSFGSLLYDMLTGRPPFYSKNKHEILKNITSKQVPLPEELSAEAKSLLKGLFMINPKERLGSKSGAEEIMKHPFFSSI